jgi:hypothetical protein
MKYVFISGVPGSCWGWPSTYMKFASELADTTNNRPWRINNNRPCLASHETNLFAGPYHEIGEQFDALSLYPNKEAIYAEIDRAFKPTDKHLVRFIQCHWFATQLDWIAENLPEVDILMSLRNPEMCYNAWHASGGWDIEYPSYKWYANSQNMWRQGQIEHRLMQQFVDKHNVPVIAGWGPDWFDWHWPEAVPFIDKSKFPGALSSAVAKHGMTAVPTGWDSLCWGLYKGKNSPPLILENRAKK